MKKIVCVFTGIMFSSLAFANNVGVWDSYQAITNSNFAKAKITATQNAIKPKQQQLKTYQDNLERLQKQYLSQADKLTDTQKTDLATQIQTHQQNYAQLVNQIQTSVETSEKEILQQVAPKLQNITQTIIKQKNIDVLIDSRNTEVTFAKPEWDITADITKAINEQVK